VLLPLVELYGIAAVREAWNAAMGYPLTWATDIRDVFTVAEILESKSKGAR
jgi:hypothetical protein